MTALAVAASPGTLADPVAIAVEILDDHGRVRHRERFALDPLRPAITIGRSVAADVVLDDPYAAPLHASVRIDAAGAVLVSDLQSVNGIVVRGERLRGITDRAIERGELTVGRTALRIRTAAEPIAAERPENGDDHRTARGWLAAAIGGALAYAGVFAYRAWLAAPQDITGALAGAVIPGLAGAGLWIGFWALLTRLLLGEWRWIRHATILFAVYVGLALVDLALDTSWFALGLAPFAPRDIAAWATAAGIALFWHISTASHASRRRALATAILVPAAVGIGSSYLAIHNAGRDVNHIGADGKIFPPALRLQSGRPLAGYFADAAKLQAEADRHRRAMPREADDDSDDEI